jgi:hypothetical protein
MTSAEFNSALRKAGFSVDQWRIVDASGKCPGFAATPRWKAIRERDAEIARRAAADERPA